MEPKDIDRRIWLEEKRQQAKKARREDLEELYVELSDNDNEMVSPNWRAATIMMICGTILVIMVVISYMGATATEEKEIYNTLGEEICFNANSGELRYIQETEKEIHVKCEEETITIGRK